MAAPDSTSILRVRTLWLGVGQLQTHKDATAASACNFVQLTADMARQQRGYLSDWVISDGCFHGRR